MRRFIVPDSAIRSVVDKMRPQLTLVTYNILADAYAMQPKHDYCSRELREWAGRSQRLIDELVSYDADVICLQERPRTWRACCAHGQRACNNIIVSRLRFFLRRNAPGQRLPRSSKDYKHERRRPAISVASTTPRFSRRISVIRRDRVRLVSPASSAPTLGVLSQPAPG